VKFRLIPPTGRDPGDAVVKVPNLFVNTAGENGMGFEKTWKIYVGDTDCFGLVYTPVVVDYAIRTLQDYRAALGLPLEFYREHDFIAPARNVDIDFLGNIGPTDALSIELVPDIGETSITYHVRGEVDDDPVFEGTMTMVYVSKTENEPIRVPDVVRQRME
jgi:acyl-CoA thioesterase FadM